MPHILWRLYRRGPVRRRKPERETKGRYTGIVSPATSRAEADGETDTFTRSICAQVTRRAWKQRAKDAFLWASFPTAAPNEGSAARGAWSAQRVSVTDRPRAVCHRFA